MAIKKIEDILPDETPKKDNPQKKEKFVTLRFLENRSYELIVNSKQGQFKQRFEPYQSISVPRWVIETQDFIDAEKNNFAIQEEV